MQKYNWDVYIGLYALLAFCSAYNVPTCILMFIRRHNWFLQISTTSMTKSSYNYTNSKSNAFCEHIFYRNRYRSSINCKIVLIFSITPTWHYSFINFQIEYTLYCIILYCYTADDRQTENGKVITLFTRGMSIYFHNSALTSLHYLNVFLFILIR